MLHIVDFNWKYLRVTLPYSLPQSRKILGSPILEDFEGFLLNLDKGQELIYIYMYTIRSLLSQKFYHEKYYCPWNSLTRFECEIP